MISYGYSVEEHEDPIVDVAEAAGSSFSQCLEPRAFLVDVIPLCESLAPRRTPCNSNNIFLSGCG